MLDDSAHFVFVIGGNGNGVPVRFYRGAAEEPTERTLWRQEMEVRQLSLALGETAAERLAFRLAVKTGEAGRPSHAVHSRTVRRPADLPCLGGQVRLELAVRRLYCRNPACSRRTFVERLPGLITPRAQRTDRLAMAQGRVGVAMGGEAGARMLQQIGMPTSGDTMLRLLRRLPLPRRPAPQVLGVDDWARRKAFDLSLVNKDIGRA